MLMLSIEPSQVAYWLRMSVRTVYRTWMHDEETGDIRPARKKVVLRCVTEEDIAFVKEVIERDSSLYLDEILDLFAEERGKRISSSTLLRVLHQLGISRKRLSMPAAEASPELQAAFICEAAKYPAHAFVWIDEVRCDRRNANRLYGRSLRGLPARRHGYFLRGNRYSSIGMMCSERWLGQLTVAGPTNSADLCFFGQHYLLPNMNKFDPDNIAPRSILVLDNCNAHYNIDFHRMMHEAAFQSARHVRELKALGFRVQPN